uniref:Putative secreted protein ovary overexpressed n=1 Tax=Rhipicephalus microplus TaxID=6941 RepID=A0A6M2D9K6_RHIMP
MRTLSACAISARCRACSCVSVFTFTRNVSAEGLEADTATASRHWAPLQVDYSTTPKESRPPHPGPLPTATGGCFNVNDAFLIETGSRLPICCE